MRAITQKRMDTVVSEALKDGVVIEESHDAYITVYKPIAGWKAAMMWWNPEGFWEPWETSPFSFQFREQAVLWGKDWAAEEGIQFKDEGGVQ